MVKTDKICPGCLDVCAWFFYGTLQAHQIRKMKSCPCGYCIVKAMCWDNQDCILFRENFKYKVGDQLK